MTDAESRLRNLQRQAAWLPAKKLAPVIDFTAYRRQRVPPRKLAPVIDLAAYRRRRVIQLVRRTA